MDSSVLKAGVNKSVSVCVGRRAGRRVTKVQAYTDDVSAAGPRENCDCTEVANRRIKQDDGQTRGRLTSFTCRARPPGAGNGALSS